MTAQRNIMLSVVSRIAVITIVVGSALACFIMLVNTRPVPPPSDSADAPPRVKVFQAQPVDVSRQWEGFGTVAAMLAADVPARVTATVIERPDGVRAGRTIQQGELLVRLDDSDFARQVEVSTQAIEDIEAQLQRLIVEQESWTRRAELAAEEARLAEAEYQRVSQAYQQEAARQREVDQARQAMLAAQRAAVAVTEEVDKIGPRRASLRAQRLGHDASLRLARTNVERSRIVSPIDGVLESVDVELGESVTAGQRIARVVNLERVEVPLALAASARPTVSAGDAVTLTASGDERRTWMARVARIAPVDDPSTRTMRVFVELEQRGEAAVILTPGQFVRGTVRSSRAEPRWVVPRRALTNERLRLIADGVVRSIPVEVDFHVRAEVPELGLSDQDWAVLKDALPPNALVVVEGSRSLSEGGPATPVMARAEATASTPSPPARRSGSLPARSPQAGAPQ